MGMSTHVVGFKPADEKWKQMKTIWDACALAKVDPPEAVGKFFGWEEPDEAGVQVDIEAKECCAEYKADDSEGFEIDVRKLPPDVTVIRFYNAY